MHRKLASLYLWPLLVWLAIFTPLTSSQTTETIADPIRVQLAWMHQSQFAGFYVAQVRKHFENQGLHVTLIEGGPNINPITELQEGRADIAVAWLGNAWSHSTEGKHVTNVAQIFSGSSLAVVCRISAGVFTAKDMTGKKVGVWNLGDETVVKELLDLLSIPKDSVEILQQSPNGQDLIDGKVACATAMAYNEYWQILASGIPASDLIVINPEVFGIPHVEDGLYVMTNRLSSPIFKEQLVRFTKAIRTGWKEARIAPTLAVETVQRMAPNLNREHQQHMLESILGIIPSNTDEFGLFDLGRYHSEVNRLLSPGKVNPTPERIWTYDIWNALKKEDKNTTPLTQATKFYVSSTTSMLAFKILVYFGVFTFALSGVLEAINRGYDLWGRLVLAFLSGVGGGTLRDLLIGGDRLPFYYVKDLTYPLGILLVVLVTSSIVAAHHDAHKSEIFKSTKKYADILGFSALAITGAAISISSNLPWFWAPICAALTCAGGGMLRDIVINQEPSTFKGVIYEEAAVAGALCLVAGFMIANHFEYSPIPVFISLIFSLTLIICLRLAIYKYHLRYPKFLGGTDSDSH
ncbi:TRIC cation channel family protein [Polynucleobacter sp. UB-Tiil-W10]|uniref:TRIC cation channel family protein n=1 Tax=Polynucleobacter sp. UB-Tiil-W10 TaxID=1855648 RepID=UPI001C0B1623|nr:TRIC cation channel family protein [Polynucleobacter sp. UB-Tiil-W10]MBU3541610.1 TRIC cation channel family protein [Polynucleobacter sp. UB-Tiil-W10]